MIEFDSYFKFVFKKLVSERLCQEIAPWSLREKMIKSPKLAKPIIANHLHLITPLKHYVDVFNFYIMQWVKGRIRLPQKHQFNPTIMEKKLHIKL